MLITEYFEHAGLQYEDPGVMTLFVGDCELTIGINHQYFWEGEVLSQDLRPESADPFSVHVYAGNELLEAKEFATADKAAEFLWQTAHQIRRAQNVH